MLSPIAIGYTSHKCELVCESGHVGEDIIALGEGRLVSLGQIPVNFSCELLNLFFILEPDIFLDNMTAQM